MEEKIPVKSQDLSQEKWYTKAGKEKHSSPKPAIYVSCISLRGYITVYSFRHA